MKVGPKKFDTPPEIFGMCAPEYILHLQKQIILKLS